MRPFFFTELNATGSINLACGTATGANCTMVATSNEGNLSGKGRHRGRGGRLALVKKGWKAFTTQDPPDANGWADQSDVIRMHRAMFPNLPDPTVTREAPGDVWEAIGPYAVSIAVDMGKVPASSPARRWVNGVPHQGMAWKRKIIGGEKWVKWVCPMHPASDTFTGVWVKWGQLVKGAKALDTGGEMFIDLYPAGEWTAEARMREKKGRKIDALQKDLSDDRETITELDAMIASKRRRIEILMGQVGSKAAGWESALVHIKAEADRLRTEGPS